VSATVLATNKEAGCCLGRSCFLFVLATGIVEQRAGSNQQATPVRRVHASYHVIKTSTAGAHWSFRCELQKVFSGVLHLSGAGCTC